MLLSPSSPKPGIQDLARTKAAMAAAKQVSDAVALHAVEHGESYPSSLADIDIEDTDSTKYQFVKNS